MRKDLELSEQSGVGPSIDWNVLESLAALAKPDAPDLRIRLLEAFLTASPALMGELRSAVAGADAPGIVKAAHPLKSSSMTMGAMSFGSMCAKLEKLGRKGAPGEAAELLARADEEFGRVVDAFERLLRDLKQ